MCIVLDGLYAKEPRFQILEKHRMKWIIVFKKGSMPEVFSWVTSWRKKYGQGNTLIKEKSKEIECRHKRTHEQRLKRSICRNEKRTTIRKTIYSWMQGIEHWDNSRKYNLLSCREEKDGEKICDYTWLISDGLRLNEDTVVELSERGRCRWNIEDGFNTQKHRGYCLEHAYSRDPVAMKIWCGILDIAYLISQLIERGSLIVKKSYGSMINLANRMFEHFCYFVFEDNPLRRRRIQIRLCWDTS